MHRHYLNQQHSNQQQNQHWAPSPHQGQMQRPPHYGMAQQPQQMPMPYPHMDHVTRQISIEDAIGIARDRVPGQVVQAELEREGGRMIFEVDIISTQGPKYEVKVDANTGEIIQVELD